MNCSNKNCHVVISSAVKEVNSLATYYFRSEKNSRWPFSIHSCMIGDCVSEALYFDAGLSNKHVHNELILRLYTAH